MLMGFVAFEARHFDGLSIDFYFSVGISGIMYAGVCLAPAVTLSNFNLRKNLGMYEYSINLCAKTKVFF